MTAKVALVTAASKGIGAGVAHELRNRGYQVALLARSEDVETLAAKLGGIAQRGSITDEFALRGLVDRALDTWGRIDVVVANTGHPAKGKPLAIAEADWRTGYELILESALRLARVASPSLIAQRSGAFVFISSYAAARPDIARPVSTVFRAALGAWVKLLAEELAPHGVRANAVLPGFIDSQPVPQAIVDTIPFGRPGTVAELARTVALLASDDAAFVTGQSLLVDGGMVRSL